MGAQLLAAARSRTCIGLHGGGEAADAVLPARRSSTIQRAAARTFSSVYCRSATPALAETFDCFGASATSPPCGTGAGALAAGALAAGARGAAAPCAAAPDAAVAVACGGEDLRGACVAPLRRRISRKPPIAGDQAAARRRARARMRMRPADRADVGRRETCDRAPAAAADCSPAAAHAQTWAGAGSCSASSSPCAALS